MLNRLVTLPLVLFGGLAAAAPPTDESVERMLRLSRAEALIEQATAQVEGTIRQSLQREMAGRTLTAEQQRALDAVPPRAAAVFRAEFHWEKLRPVYVAIYKESLDQADVDGMIAFYQTPAGQAFLSKMPAIMQRAMAVTQAQVEAMMPRLHQAVQEALKDAKLPPKT
jgi:hypothetical protein